MIAGTMDTQAAERYEHLAQGGPGTSYFLATPSDNTIPTEQVSAVCRAARCAFFQAQGTIPSCTNFWRDLRHIENCPFVLLCGDRWRIFLTCLLEHRREPAVINEDIFLAVRYALPLRVFWT